MTKRFALVVSLTALVAAGVPIAPSPAATAKKPPIIGLWKGKVTDASVEQPYGTTIRVKKASTGFKGSTSYENIDCAGKLRGKKVSKRHYRFTETITENTDFCGETWMIEVTLRRHHRADWDWADGEGHTASGRLKRVSQ